MEKNDEVVSVLNDLLQINNDRIEGYEKAIEDTKDTDVDLKETFTNMADQSREYANQLRQEITKFNGDPTSDTTISGKIYRTWMDVKTAFAGKDRENVLGLCEFGEDAAQKAYKEALESDGEIPSEVCDMIKEQKNQLKQSHDKIKTYRDAAKED